MLVAVVGLTAVLAVQARANAELKVANTRLELSNRREVKANAELKAANERERAPVRAGPGSDPDVLHRRQRRPALEAEGV